MPFSDINNPDHIRAAMTEFDGLGREAFLQTYGFAPARTYHLVESGRRYDSKAIVGVAHKYARPDLGPLHAEDFSGGQATVGNLLKSLGFSVEISSNAEHGHFNTLLEDAGISSKEVALVRHSDTRQEATKTPYTLWTTNLAEFEIYQATQDIGNRAKFARQYWASFVVTPDKATLFVGLYDVRYKGLLQETRPYVHGEGVDLPGTCDDYQTTLNPSLSAYEGRLIIDWGPGARAWVQKAANQNKPIIAILPDTVPLAPARSIHYELLEHQELSLDVAAIEARADISETTRKTLTDARLGQGRFKDDAIRIEPKCRITDIADRRHLRASHIKPWRDSSDKERLDGNNGLLLAPHIDHLFDRGHISFADDGALLISPALDCSILSAWSIPDTITSRPFSEIQCRYLAYHRQKYGFEA